MTHAVGQLVANQSSPSLVTPHISVAALWDLCNKVKVTERSTPSDQLNHQRKPLHPITSTPAVVFRLTSKLVSGPRAIPRRLALIDGFGKGSRTHRVDILSWRALRTCRRNHFYSSLHPSAATSLQSCTGVFEGGWCCQLQGVVFLPSISSPGKL